MAKNKEKKAKNTQQSKDNTQNNAEMTNAGNNCNTQNKKGGASKSGSDYTG